ncbi:MAG TPA: DUF5309 family protein [Anaerolineae bacterium]|nr:DUF5309 family protein [Anaerolineae bacterium]
MPAAETTYFGMEGTGNWSHPDYRPKNYRQAAFELFPDSPSPFTYILSKLPTSSVDDPEFKLFEWRLPKQTCIVQTELAAGTALLEVDTVELFQSGDGAAYADEGTEPAYSFKPGDILRVEDIDDCLFGSAASKTGNPTDTANIAGPELVVVKTITDADTITVYRYWGGTNVDGPSSTTPVFGTILSGAVLRWAGSVYQEGSQSPLSLTKRASVVSNYTGIFKDAVKITGTAEQMKTRPYKPWPQFKGECLERHMMKLEWALLNGVPEETTSIAVLSGDGSEYSRTTGGFRYFVEQAHGSVDFSAGVDIDTVEDEMESSFTYGSKEKAGITGYRALNVLNKMVRNNSTWNWNAEALPKKQTYGLEVFQLRCPFGVLNIVPHKLLAESAVQTQDVLIVDTKYVEYVYMKGRDTAWKDNVQLPDEDARKGYFMTECGLRMALPEVHSVWTGLAALA